MTNEDAERIERHRLKGEQAAERLQNELRADRRQYLLDKGATDDQAQQGSMSSSACRAVESQLTHPK